MEKMVMDAYTKKEKCLLEFCSMTQRVWSLVEKEVDRQVENLIGTTQMKMHLSEKGSLISDESLENEDVFQQLAFSAVEQKTGSNCSKLSILERHMTYSLSREKTTIRVYIMNYTEAMNEGLVEIPIKAVISSLQGPLIRTDQPSEVTSVVKYYHLLPYYDILSDWISRETHYHGFLPSLRHPTVVDMDYQPELDKPLTEKGHVFSNSDQKDQVLCMPSNNTTKGENKDTNYKKKNNPLSREKSSVVDCTRKTGANDSLLKLDRQLDTNDQIFTDKSTLNEYRNRTNHAVINIKSPVESCRNASSPGTYIPINIEDNASLNQHQQSSASEGMITRETIISDICISKRENNNLQDAKSSPNNGRPEKV
ncbi:uncharacterized protein LOC135674591 isoform X2 [Musa acuminata AAA Group]|uniref:uncharacterized protein LOC103986404 isoform X2 n=1 Tax=Musa acuminata AAA Group TaxID=214697 RepID=UPI0031DB5BCD